MVVYPHPFDDSEGVDVDEGNGFDEEADTGVEDITDTTGDIDYYEDDDKLQVSLRKSNEEVTPIHQYLKTFSDDAYNKLIGKDMYAFLHGHREDIIEVMSVGREVSEVFKTLNPEDVKEVYRIILSEVEKMGWSSKRMADELLSKFPHLKQYEADRIIRTEVARVLYYAKEQTALRDDKANRYLYSWNGPLDSRTTPMCHYLQTGTLREKDIKLLAKNGFTPDELPVIPKDGLPLEELKEACRQVAFMFGYDMISDWVMHINCRHTFIQGKRVTEPLDDGREDEIQTILQQIEDGTSPYLQDDGREDREMQIEALADDDEILMFDVADGYDSYLFVNSIYDIPTLYNAGYGKPIRVFRNTDEEDLSSWARAILQLQDEGIDDTTILWALQDQGVKEDDGLIGYVIAHSYEILDRAEREAWLY